MGNDTQLSTNGKKEPIPQDSASIVRERLFGYFAAKVLRGVLQ